MKRWILFGCWLTLVVPAMGAGPIDDIYFFGDSLTDTGNMVLLQPEQVPDPPFARGRFCDGPMWPEYLSSMLLGDAGKGGPFQYGLLAPAGHNFAVVGASTFHSPSYLNLPGQIGAAVTHRGGALNPEALYVLCFPTADIAYYYSTTPPEQQNIGVALFVVLQAAQNLYQGIARLHAAGARRFLVFNTPDAGYTPLMRSLGQASAGHLLSPISNLFLEAALSAFPRQLSGNLYLMDFYVLSHLLHLDAALLGGYNFSLRDAVNPCMLQTNGQVVPDPDCSRSMYVDGVHLSTRAHSWVATLAVYVLANRPLYSVPAR